MNVYLGFLKRRFLWALAGLVVFLSYSWLWGGWFVRTMLGVTGLGGVDPSEGPQTTGQWLGLTIGTLVVMAPAILGFLAYLVAWIGWPGRPIPPRRHRWAGAGMGLAVAYGIWGAMGVVGTAVLSSWIFGEQLNAMMAAGIALVVAGVLAIEVGAQRARRAAAVPAAGEQVR